MCQAACPMTSFDIESPDHRTYRGYMGHYLTISSYRSKIPEVLERCQDGGVVTSLLLYLLDKNVVDAAMVTQRTDRWVPRSKLTNERAEIIKAAGSKYAANPIFDVLVQLKDIPIEELKKFHVTTLDDLRLVAVGLPCQISGLKKVQNLGVFPSNLVKFKIGLFCFKNFTYDKMIHEFLEKEKNIDPTTIKKFVIKGDMNVVLQDGSSLLVKSQEYDKYINEGCKWCMDLTSQDADVSCGNIGSATGFTTVVTRTKLGADIVQRAKLAGYIEEAPMEDMKKINKLAGLKVKKSKKNGKE